MAHEGQLENYCYSKSLTDAVSSSFANRLTSPNKRKGCYFHHWEPIPAVHGRLWAFQSRGFAVFSLGILRPWDFGHAVIKLRLAHQGRRPRSGAEVLALGQQQLPHT